MKIYNIYYYLKNNKNNISIGMSLPSAMIKYDKDKTNSTYYDVQIRRSGGAIVKSSLEDNQIMIDCACDIMESL